MQCLMLACSADCMRHRPVIYAAGKGGQVAEAMQIILFRCIAGLCWAV